MPAPIRKFVSIPLLVTGLFVGGFGLLFLLPMGLLLLVGGDVPLSSVLVSALCVGVGGALLGFRSWLRARWAREDARRERLRTLGRKVPARISEVRLKGTNESGGPVAVDYVVDVLEPGVPSFRFVQRDLSGRRVGDEVTACLLDGDAVTLEDLSQAPARVAA